MGLVDEEDGAAVAWFVREAKESCRRGERIVVVADDDVRPPCRVALELVGADVVACGNFPNAIGVKYVMGGNRVEEGVIDRIVVAASVRELTRPARLRRCLAARAG